MTEQLVNIDDMDLRFFELNKLFHIVWNSSYVHCFSTFIPVENIFVFCPVNVSQNKFIVLSLTNSQLNIV